MLYGLYDSGLRCGRNAKALSQLDCPITVIAVDHEAGSVKPSYGGISKGIHLSLIHI